MLKSTVTTTWEAVLKGRSIKRVGNRCSSVLIPELPRQSAEQFAGLGESPEAAAKGPGQELTCPGHH